MIGNDLHNIGAIHHLASKSNGWILTDGTSSLAKKIGLATRQYQNIPQNKAKVIALVNSKENSPNSMIPKLKGTVRLWRFRESRTQKRMQPVLINSMMDE